MTTQSDFISNTIITDLTARKLKVVAFVCEDEHDKLSVLSYDNNTGLIDFISPSTNAIVINERLGGRMVRGIVEIGERPE